MRKRGCKREEAFDRRGFRRQRWHCRSEGSLRQMPGLLSIHSRASFAVTKATRFLFFFFFYPNPASPELSFLFLFFFSVSNRSDWLAFRLSPSLVTTSDSLSSNSFQNNQRLTEFVSHPYLPQDIARLLLEENRIRNRGKQQRFLYIL